MITQADLKRCRKTVILLRIITHQTVRDIINLLNKKRRPMSVKDIYIALRIEQCVASQFLAKMRSIEIVTTERRGKYVYYTLIKDKVLDHTIAIKKVADEVK